MSRCKKYYLIEKDNFALDTSYPLQSIADGENWWRKLSLIVNASRTRCFISLIFPVSNRSAIYFYGLIGPKIWSISFIIKWSNFLLVCSCVGGIKLLDVIGFGMDWFCDSWMQQHTNHRYHSGEFFLVVWVLVEALNWKAIIMSVIIRSAYHFTLIAFLLPFCYVSLAPIQRFVLILNRFIL